MFNFILASMMALNFFAMDVDHESQEFVSETASQSIQIPQNCQALIEKLYQYINEEKKPIEGSCISLEPMSAQRISTSESWLPGTLIFAGSSEANIDTLILYLNESECCKVISQNDNTELTICSIADLNLNQESYDAIYRLSDTNLIKKSCAEYTHSIAAPASFLDEKFDSYFVNEQQLPYVISPKNCSEISLSDFKAWAEDHQNELKDLLTWQGAILLRGFPIDSADDFGTIVKAVIGRELNDYKGEGSRNRIAQGVYTSTKAPLKFKIPLHNELTCTQNPVDYICFYCDIAPEAGAGQTILARTEEVTTEMMKKQPIWDFFNGKSIKYISRHPPEGNFFARINPTHRTWQQVFETSDRNEVESICVQKGYDFKWNGDWLEIIRLAPAIRGPDQYFDHPYWYNQAHLYHSNSRIHGGWMNHLLANLLYIAPSTRAYDVEFEDGTPIPKKVVYEIYDTLDEKTIKFDWEKNDVLLLDNRRTLHGRAPCVGPRRILTAMIQ